MERHEFRHALIAEAAAETVLPRQRRRLHVEIAEARRRCRHCTAQRRRDMAEIAHHWFEGRDLPRALVASIKAGEAAARRVRSSSRSDRTNGRWSCGTSCPTRRRSAGSIASMLGGPPTSASCRVIWQAAAGLLREGIEILESAGDPIPGCAPVRTVARSGRRAPSIRRSRRTTPKSSFVPDAPTADRACGPRRLRPGAHARGRYRESLPIAQEANDIAVAAGQRQIEGHAATTLGVDLVYATPTGGETAILLIRDALNAEEVRDYDDIGRGYACLGSALDVLNRMDESLAASVAGVERMRVLGLSATYGAFILMNEVDALISFGRWDEAFRKAEAAEPDQPGQRAPVRDPAARPVMDVARVVR